MKPRRDPPLTLHSAERAMCRALTEFSVSCALHAPAPCQVRRADRYVRLMHVYYAAFTRERRALARAGLLPARRRAAR